MELTIFKINYPSEVFGLEEQNGGYGKEQLSCNGHIDENVFELVNKP